ncbi:Perchlorate reductase subunit gamma precursor [Planctomycetes bacterium Pan216]|uniref:Perchlorate reductase subunit gamma n=1 Tax=Kolteria novifilia TaxID=2527975 RepID=A0A518B5V0_9BACT|nr:Perchlorate reductase subunit gamma precursor [Planctomycetes bacterium Pan216]
MERDTAVSDDEKVAKSASPFVCGLLLGGAVGATFAGFAAALVIAATIEFARRPAVVADVAEHDAEKEAFAPAPLFLEWPEQKPDAAFLLTGELHGYLRPCGCSPGQQGGLPRLGGVLEFLANEKGWDVLPVDLGDLIGKSGRLEPLRYVYALESLQRLGYPAIGVGTKDLGQSVDEVLGQALNLDQTKLLQGNLVHKDADFNMILEETIPSVKVEQVGETKVAVASLMGDSQVGKLPDPSVSVRPTKEAVNKLAESVKAEMADVNILLGYMTEKEAETLAKDHPGLFSLILCKSESEDSATQEATWVGDTLITWVGQKGKSVGVVGYWKDLDPKLHFELVPLDQRFAEIDSMNEIYARFVEAIKDGGYVEQVARVPLPDGNEFVGAERCGKCHTKAYDHWKKMGHAHALETLTKAVPAGQDYNPECVSCHTTGYGYESGFVSIDITPKLGGNQCENCHGAGKLHSDHPKDPKYHADMRLSRFTVEAKCIKCHDTENSIHFNFEKYWPKVAHPWRD